jgi:RNA polymerase sigma factor for flagellar operon FliA|tara:strand:- start:839 stop:1540 length:702 start_codon:yes stop_codon:yes gene_type:complete
MPDIDAYEQQSPYTEVSIGQHYSLVKRIAYHLRTRLPSSISTDDLIQAGMEGLIHAQRAYEPSRGIDFELFAKTRIRGAMLDEVRRISYSTRSAVTIKREQDQAISALSKQLGRAPKGAEIAAYLEKDLATYEKERIIAEGVDMVSTDALAAPFDEPGEDDESPDSSLEREQQLEMLTQAIEKLPERARMVLALYYQEEMNLKEIGAILDVSESRVSQIISETAGKLRGLMSE